MPGEAPERARDRSLQTLFERLFRPWQDAVVTTDGEGRILEVNPQVETLFGYRRQELLGRPMEILFPERFRQIVPAAPNAQTSALHSPDFGPDLFGKRRDDGEFPVEITLAPIETARGRVVLCVIRDISEKIQTEDALRQSEQKLRSLLESVNEYAVYLLDLGGRIQTWHPGAEQIKGYKPGEIIGHHFSCFFTKDDMERGKPDQELRLAVAEGRFEDEYWHVRKDGSRFGARLP